MRTRWLVASALMSLTVLLCACSKPEPAFEDVPPAEELYDKGQKILEGGTLLYVIPRVNYSDAIETFQTIIDNYPYSDYAVLSELRIADAYFEQDKYEEALSYYRDFGDLHPQNEKVPYTLYRAALCHERRMKSPNRDQTATRDALVYLDRLIYSHPHSEYSLEAEELWRTLRLQLGEQIMGIADFYLDRGEFESAAARYRSLLNEYPGLDLDATALYRLGTCYLEMNRKEEAGRIFQAIVQNYFDSDAARDAEQMLAREE